MPFDPEQAAIIRRTLECLPLDPGEELSERKMFGGLCFLLNGKMLMGVGKGEVMLRLETDEYENALDAGLVSPMDFTGKPLANFAYLAPSECGSEDRLLEWGKKSLYFVRSKQTGSNADKPPKPYRRH